MTETTEMDAFAHALRSRLDTLAEMGRTVTFWWRDDDAVAAGEQLDRLIGSAERHGVPLGLAVIPKDATDALAARVGRSGLVEILQHGWRHKNHQPKGSKAAELGDARELGIVLAELRHGFTRLTALFGDRFRPVLVPPWNRIAREVAGERAAIGLVGLSTFGETDGEDRRVNCHLDPISWKTTRGFVGWPRAAHLIAEELDRRLAGSDEPFGLLTHHLVHDDALWQFVETFLGVAARHPVAVWPRVDRLFGLPETHESALPGDEQAISDRNQ